MKLSAGVAITGDALLDAQLVTINPASAFVSVIGFLPPNVEALASSTP